MSSHFQIHIDRLDIQITDLQAEITVLQAETGGSAVVQTCLDNQVAVLATKKSALESKRSGYQAKETARTNAVAAFEATKTGWSGEEQTTVDAISTLFSGKYDGVMERKLKTAATQDRADFFTHYGEATTDVQREVIIKDYMTT